MDGDRNAGSVCAGMSSVLAATAPCLLLWLSYSNHTEHSLVDGATEAKSDLQVDAEPQVGWSTVFQRNREELQDRRRASTLSGSNETYCRTGIIAGISLSPVRISMSQKSAPCLSEDTVCRQLYTHKSQIYRATHIPPSPLWRGSAESGCFPETLLWYMQRSRAMCREYEQQLTRSYNTPP